MYFLAENIERGCSVTLNAVLRSKSVSSAGGHILGGRIALATREYRRAKSHA
jgi:hypothetical protein